MTQFLTNLFLKTSILSQVYYQKLNISKDKVVKILERVNYIITDCIRDFDIIRAHNFKGFFLGVFPGNGGINYPLKKSLISPKNRDTILIKGYNDDIGKGIEIIKSFDDKTLAKPMASMSTYLIFASLAILLNAITF